MVVVAKFVSLCNLFNLSSTCRDKVRKLIEIYSIKSFYPTIDETRPTVGPSIGAGVSVGPGPAPVAGPGPAPAIQQASSGGANVIYIPRNVYVPVIKPVFVPRERKFSIIMIIK